MVESVQLLTPSEVATIFRVDPRTIARWAQSGKLGSIKTIGGHRRFRETDIQQLLGEVPEQREA